MTKTQKRNILIGSLCAIVLLMVVGYAAFGTSLRINGTSNITSNWDIKITNVVSKNIIGSASNSVDPSFDGLSATFKTDLKSPGDSIEYEITVSNTGNLNAKLDKYTLIDENNEAIKFTQTGLTNGELLVAGFTKVFTVKVEYLSTVTEQLSNLSSNLSITLDYSQADTGYIPSGQTASEKLTSNLVTSGDGLYTDTYEVGRYVYRGSKPNNYITFNDEDWRILSIEKNGSLKIILNDRLPEAMAFDAASNRLNSDNTYCRIYSDGKYYGCNAWNKVEGNLTVGSVTGTVSKDASLNTYLNGLYYDNLTEESKGQIQISTFNTGAVADIGVVTSSAGNTLSDLIVREKTLTWTGKVGLINITDYMKTSLDKCDSQYNAMEVPDVTGICKNKNYLYKPDYWWWSLNTDTRQGRFVEAIMTTGNLGVASAGYAAGYVRPVIYLKSDIKLSGEGTSSNPYIID